MITRRSLLAAGAVVLTGARTAAADAVPNSAGSEPPKLNAPANACDGHHHIYDARFPVSPHWRGGRPDGATAADYRLLQKRLGVTRHVIVQPSTYGVDNRCLLDALDQFGAEARGIVVIDENTDDTELKRMDQRGVRGVRVNFLTPQAWGVTTAERLEQTAKRIAPLGWHVQVLMSGDQIAQHEAVLAGLPVPVVFDHLGRIPQPVGLAHPGAQAMLRLADTGRGWIKLSEPYADTKIGPPDYPDTSAVARACVQAAPDRVIWGSDWPHPTEKEKPDDAVLFDLLSSWAPDAAIREKILVGNPAQLFGFA
ncbi:2-pyrone-4,6-dicarboxylate hydrolase [Bradyrhizobium sp. SSBR45G]|uniref:amidohydrolase family protein n=1 Tax=unclassified Bradyrhizobium TaxID=2631580 RepID=UPI0023429912|nr:MULTISPECIES: amidohydrolase family protein [unclassified Bradyrhizobium]GLH75544.1 2-pyrone-4,6-dicarboxylate hydrolase [Bradyrhizobium sp. SSBR45G]GLH82669.1 2-pyrone-4,6-dicarboxylate hydrolase [Bradyrhizobium sp. SSBR45R]